MPPQNGQPQSIPEDMRIRLLKSVIDKYEQILKDIQRDRDKSVILR